MKRIYFFVALVLITVIAAITLYSSQIETNSQGRRSQQSACIAGQSLPEIVRESQAAVVGRVISISKARFASEGNRYHEDALIYRDVTIKIEDKLFDSISLANRITIPVIGGSVKLPLKVLVLKKEPPGTIRSCGEETHFEPGERVLLFLKNGIMGFKEGTGEEATVSRLQIVGAWQGKFRLEGDKAISDVPERSTNLQTIKKLIKESGDMKPEKTKTVTTLFLPSIYSI